MDDRDRTVKSSGSLYERFLGWLFWERATEVSLNHWARPFRGYGPFTERLWRLAGRPLRRG